MNYIFSWKIGRASKFVYAELHANQSKAIAIDFLRNLIEAAPYKIHKVVTDNGIHFNRHATVYFIIISNYCRIICIIKIRI